MLYNFVFSQSHWDNAAKTNPFARILHNYSQDKFWKTQPEISGLEKDTVFLDLGCGIGRIARSIAPVVQEYCGVDFSEEMIEKAKFYHKDYSNVQFFVNNGRDLSIFEENTFDFVYSSLVFIHIQKEQIVGYVDEIYRVLKPGGIYHTRNFPSMEKYANGFLFDEVLEIFRNFGEINIEDGGDWYHCIRCQK